MEVLDTLNLSEVITSLPPSIWEGIGNLITILKAIGIFFIIYFVYLVVNGVFSWKRNKSIKNIEEKVCILEKKLDSLIGQKNKKEKKKKK